MSKFLFPELETAQTIETEQMMRVINRTLAVHRGGALLPWVGRSRLGKTTTARYANELINKNFSSDDPRAFRSFHYEVGGLSGWSGDDQKKGIRSLYHACAGRMDEGLYRGGQPEDIARRLIRELKKRSVQMIFVDEAGNLSVDAIRGMVLARNTAENNDWTLTIVFIGMDDLPGKLVSLPQIHNRTDEWCYFEPYSLDEVFMLLGKLHPHFAGLNLKNKEHLEQVEFIYEQFGGVFGLIVPFIRRLKSRLHTELDGIIDLEGLMAVHLSTLRDKDKALQDSAGLYSKQVKETSLEDLLKKA